MYTTCTYIYTCFSSKWHFLSFLICAPLIETWANFCWGRRRVSQGWQKHFSFVQAKYSAGAMHLCRGCERADYPLKILMVVSYATCEACTCKGVWGVSPGENLNLCSLRVYLLAIHISAQIDHFRISRNMQLKYHILFCFS